MDVLLTAYARTIFALTETPMNVPLPFTIAMDLRRYLSDPDSIGVCNLSSLAWIELCNRAGMTFDQVLAEVHRAFDTVMKNSPGIGLAMVMRIVSVLGYRGFVAANRLRIRMARNEGREFPSLSNIGGIDRSALDFADVHMTKARFFGPVFYPPTFYVVSGSFGDVLYFTASYPGNLAPAALLEQILDRIVQEIDSLQG